MEINRMSTLRIASSVLVALAVFGQADVVTNIRDASQGTVYAQNSPMMLKYRDGFYDKALTQRLKDGRLANVVRLDRDMSDLGIPSATVDLAMTALNFHDIYNSAGEAAALEFMSDVYGVLKPGGVFAVIDHVGSADGDNNRLCAN